MNILAIDPGFERVGIAVLEKPTEGVGKETLLYSACFQTSPKLPFHERLLLIGKELEHIIETYKPEVLGIETLFFNTNQKTAMQVSEARGMMIYVAKNSGLIISEYNPLQIKNAVAGYGKATKEDVAFMVEKLIHIENPVKYDDEMDAIAVGLTCSASYAYESKTNNS